MTGPQPITKPRSEWTRDDDIVIGPVSAEHWHRRVNDGTLTVLVANEPDGWHLSISHRPPNERRALRYPTWDEIADARYRLLPDDITVAMLLPPPSQYVAAHPTTFHLHQIADRS